MAELNKRDEERLRGVENYISRLDGAIGFVRAVFVVTAASLLAGIGFLIWQFIETRSNVAVLQRTLDDIKARIPDDNKALANDIKGALARIKIETVPSRDQYVSFLLSKNISYLPMTNG